MSLNLTEWYVNEALRRMERLRDESPQGAVRWRLEWRAITSPPRRPVLAWVGDRLVGLGERLQGWAAPSTDALSARPGPSVPTT
jgi:hypothetical protein